MFQNMHKKVLQFLHNLLSLVVNSKYSFEWDEIKGIENQRKHGISFEKAQEVFLDPNNIIYKDLDHSTLDETRYFCLGKIEKKCVLLDLPLETKKLE